MRHDEPKRGLFGSWKAWVQLVTDGKYGFRIPPIDLKHSLRRQAAVVLLRGRFPRRQLDIDRRNYGSDWCSCSYSPLRSIPKNLCSFGQWQLIDLC